MHDRAGKHHQVPDGMGVFFAFPNVKENAESVKQAAEDEKQRADGADCGLWRRVGIHTRTILALSLTPGGDALGLSAVSGRLAAGAGGLVWRAGLAGTAAGRGVRWGGSGCRLAHCGG